MDFTSNTTCLVELNRSDVTSTPYISSCSGVYIGSDRVLTVASCLLPLLATDDSERSSHALSLKNILKNDYHGQGLFEHINCNVTFEKVSNDGRNRSFCVPSNVKNELRHQPLKGSVMSADGVKSKYHRISGSIFCVWKSQRFSQALAQAFPKYASWCLNENNQTDKEGEKTVSQTHKSKETQENKKQGFETEDLEAFLPYFAVIKLVSCFSSLNKKLVNMVDSDEAVIGNEVSIQATPFGNLSASVFMNSVSRGVLCNKAGERSELLMTDARCIPGCEGGALYLGKGDGQKLLGIIVSPLCWKSTEWVGLSIACSVADILSSLQSHLQGRGIPDVWCKTTDNLKKMQAGQVEKYTPQLSDVSKRVVMIQSEGSWGSGVLVDSERGYILTCGHVVKKVTSVRVRLDAETRQWMTAEIVYAKPDVVAFDIAILKLVNVKKLKLADLGHLTIARGHQGQCCYVIGHALFGKEYNMAASVSMGVVSTALRYEGVPVLLQSTCAVHNGASGGALVDEWGALLGIVVCNAKDSASGSCYPHVNLSVPVSTIWPMIQAYLRTKDVTHLEPLEIKDKRIQNFWQLKREDSSHPGIEIIEGCGTDVILVEHT